ncbi:hypothetical protein D3C72_1930680 [compost metagenome]
MLDAFGYTHCWPEALTPVVGADSGIERGQCGVGIQQRRAAEDGLFVAVRTAQINRAADLGERAGPGPQRAVDQVFTLFGRAVEAVFFRDAAGVGKQVAENRCCGHVATP